MAKTIAYIMSRFPNLPETFILREMTELEQSGWKIELYPLILQRQLVMHAQAESWIERAHALSFLSRDLINANASLLFRQQRHYSSLWGETLRENRTSPNYLIRAIALLPKAIYAARLMQRQGVNHVHAHYASHPALVAWLIHRVTNISYSITVHAHDIFVRTAMLATKLRDAAFVVAISDYNREHLARIVGPWVHAKTYVIHCGVNPASYRPHVSARGERFEIISIGSLQPYKGHMFLIEACALLKKRAIPFRCRIIGTGKELKRLERKIREAHLEGSIELLGAMPEDQVASLLPSADCYVQPSIVTSSGKMEGIPVALMEALACKLPVVATSLSGVPELVRDGETGYLVSPTDSKALADAIHQVYANPIEAERRAECGRKLVIREFDLHSNVARLSTLFEQTLSRAAENVSSTSISPQLVNNPRFQVQNSQREQ